MQRRLRWRQKRVEESFCIHNPTMLEDITDVDIFQPASLTRRQQRQTPIKAPRVDANPRRTYRGQDTDQKHMSCSKPLMKKLQYDNNTLICLIGISMHPPEIICPDQ